MMIPFNILKRKLEQKCFSLGINFIQQNENYTSKCSFLDGEVVQKHDIYCGRRIKRGLFETSSGIKLNSDINGAANIMKKVFSNVFVTDEIVASMVKPTILNII